MHNFRTFFFIVMMLLAFLGCHNRVKPGEYVQFQSQHYPFMKERFIEHSMRCMMLRDNCEIDSQLYFCSGVNYSNVFSEGLVFAHQAPNVKERMIGATLALETPQNHIEIKCISEMPKEQIVGKEYVLCMTQQRYFDWSHYLAQVDANVTGRLYSGVMNATVFEGLLTPKKANRLQQFINDARSDAKQSHETTFRPAAL